MFVLQDQVCYVVVLEELLLFCGEDCWWCVVDPLLG